MSQSSFLKVMIGLALLSCFGCSNGNTDKFKSNLSREGARFWIGPEYWANPLQDWQLNEGRFECITSGGDRNVYLLTHELVPGGEGFHMSVLTGKLDASQSQMDEGWIGFKVGVRGDYHDYRDNAVRGEGFPIGITTEGKLFIGLLDSTAPSIDLSANTELMLVVDNENEPGGQRVVLGVSTKKGELLASLERKVDNDWLIGGVALACSYGAVPQTPKKRPEIIYGNWGFKPRTQRKGTVCWWFKDWILSGEKVKSFPEHAWGPILFAQYTLSRNTMKLTAQMVPVASFDDRTVQLEIKQKGKWTVIGTAPIDHLARTATFKIADWTSTEDVDYRLSYGCYTDNGRKNNFYFEGLVRHEPWDKEEIVVAGFTGNNDLGFPNNDIFNGVKYQDPDFLFFSGDQIYEGVGGYGTQTDVLELACLDYLRKWYLYGWAYGEILKNRPAVSIPDDHDVYHGNVWGAGGIATPPGLKGAAAQDQGGYKMPPEWVNMVQRTQTSHLPDPVDPQPVAQGIGVYFTDISYAGISFAVIEDRKFKSAPKVLLPEAGIVNGWAKTPGFDARVSADVPGAELLGKRQINFLENWTADWKDSVWMKVVLSQTIFANVATLPEEDAHTDANVPRLRIMEPGGYAENDVRVQDFDSDAWPQSEREHTLRVLRKGFAFHIAGDQHLGSTIQYGVEEYRDAGYAFCVPAISNVWPRRWYPREGGMDREDGAPKYTGDIEDGFGNKMTVHAVSNPTYTGKVPSLLYDRATGYGIVRFNRSTRDITIECWPRLSDPSKEGAQEYPGWPIVINQLDNRYRTAGFNLPLVKVPQMKNSVMQLIDESTGQIEMTLRIKGNAFKPLVRKKGKYTLKVGEPGTDKWKIFPGMESVPYGMTREFIVMF